MRAAVTLLLATLVMAAAPDRLLTQVDHLVYATPDLTLGIETAERLFGVRATPGGQHPGEGTRNALIALGPTSYFEIIGPDPEQPAPARGRRFGIDEIKAPRLTTWVAKGSGLEKFAADAAGHGVNLGAVIPGSRKRPDGVVLSWTYTDPRVVLADRLVPYLIDWGTSPHPSATAARGVTLLSLRAEHPDAEHVQQMLKQLGLDLAVTVGPKPALIATFDSPKGRVELRSAFAAAQAPDKPVAKAEQTPVRFIAHEIATGLKFGYMTTVADLNHDGRPDIIGLASNTADLVWYENPAWTPHVLTTVQGTLINVAAADTDGDGIPEIAFAYGFSTRPDRSAGNLAILTHGADPREPWTLREIDRAPSTHRVRWFAAPNGEKWIVNAPLAGLGLNPPEYDGPSSLYFYRPPDWKREVITAEEHGVVHAIEPTPWDGQKTQVLLTAGFTGIHLVQWAGNAWTRTALSMGAQAALGSKSGSSDVLLGHLGKTPFLAAIEPFHGDNFVIYREERGAWQRQVVDAEVVDAHTIAIADLDGDGRDEVVLGNRRGPKSVWLYSAGHTGDVWTRSTLDEDMNASGCTAADLNADRKIDLVCISGTTLKWYENAGGKD